MELMQLCYSYVYYLLSDLLLALIIIFLLKKQVIYCNTFLIYVFTGLLVNALLFVMMILITEFTSYYYITAHPYLWPLAYLYSYGINISDFMMVLALLTNKDFFGFIGGLQKFSPEFMIFFAPNNNSFKRLQPGYFSPQKNASNVFPLQEKNPKVQGDRSNNFLSLCYKNLKG